MAATPVVQRSTPVRVAVVDIGTNSTRLLVADVDPASGAVARARAPLGGDAPGRRRGRRRLALRGGDARACSRRSPTTAREIDAHGCERNLAVLTSAVRDASNGERFAARVRERVRPRRARAQRRRRGAADVPRRDVRPRRRAERGDEPTVVIDIGGGSTEFVVGRGAQRRLSRLAARRRGAHERAPHPPDPPAAARAAGARGRRARDLPRRACPAQERARGHARHRRRRHRHLGGGDRPGARPLRPRARARLPAHAGDGRTAARAPGRHGRSAAPARSSACTPTARPRSSPA